LGAHRVKVKIKPGKTQKKKKNWTTAAKKGKKRKRRASQPASIGKKINSFAMPDHVQANTDTVVASSPPLVG